MEGIEEGNQKFVRVLLFIACQMLD